MVKNLYFLTRKVINRLKLIKSYLYFKYKHPGVKIAYPAKIGTFYSQDGQDLYLISLLLNLIQHHPHGWIVDVGANDPVYFSNSYAFEKFFACKVLAIDPLQHHEDTWLELRPNALFVAAAAGSNPGYITLKIPCGNLADDMFSITAGGTFKGEHGQLAEHEVPIVRLDEMFIKYGINEIILVSIDVEGNEMDVLNSIDFNAVHICSFVIENNTKSMYGDDELRNYLESKHYVFFARIGRMDDVFVHKSLLNGGPYQL